MTANATIIDGIELSNDAARNVKETGVSVRTDVLRMRSGAIDAAALLDECLDGTDDDRVQGWHDYVDAVARAADTGSLESLMGIDGEAVSDCRDYGSDAVGVVIERGWYADDGNAEVYYPDATSADQAREEYVSEGDWAKRTATKWIHVRAWRRAHVLHRDGCVTIDDKVNDDGSQVTTLAPEEPECETGHEHEWVAPHWLLGGLEENPGVVSHGGGVICVEACRHCGCERVTDTWAQDPVTGQQGLTSVAYEPGKYADDLAEHGAEA